jgi:RecA/RadA recombinase
MGMKEKLQQHRKIVGGSNQRLEKRLEKHNEERLRHASSIDATDRSGVFKGPVSDRLEAMFGSYGIEERATAALATQTGILSLDIALGGGLPTGVTEIYGRDSVGKTALLYQILCMAQLCGKKTVLCATEVLDVPYLQSNGVDPDKLLLIRAEYGEDAIGLMLEQVTEDDCVIGLDSASAMRPQFDEPLEWSIMMHDFIRTALHFMRKRSCIVMTNQVRARKSIEEEKVFAGGVDSYGKRIASELSTRLELSRREVSEDAYTLVVDVVANLATQPATLLELPAKKGSGIDAWVDLVRVAVGVGILTTKGPWYYWGGYVLGQGEVAAADFLRRNPLDASKVMEKTLRTAVRG